MRITETEINFLKNDILYAVKIKMGWNDSMLESWWVKPNINFEDLSPKDMVESGSGKHLLAYIKGVK